MSRLLLMTSLIGSFLLGGTSFYLFQTINSHTISQSKKDPYAKLVHQPQATSISVEDIWHASNIAGLDLTHSEMDSMVVGLQNHRQAYLDNRKIDIPTDIAPALSFNPLPSGFETPTEQKKITYGEPKNTKMPDQIESLAFYSIIDLAHLLKTRQISSEELTKFFIKRLKKYDGTLSCVITITEDLALQQARKADREIQAGNYKGLLHGVPYGAKDLFATKSYKTTWGAMPYKEQELGYNATVINKLEASGAVLVAKMTLGALAMGDVWYGGKTKTPWDPSRGSSGSSAGSASAVAAGLLPFALGTETLGSIVSPSTVCGTTGLRPTFGRVSRFGAMPLSWTMDKVGPICRSAEDCAVVFDVIRGSDGKDQDVIDAAFNYNHEADPKKLKVGYLKLAFDRNYRFHQADSMTLAKLTSMGYELVPIELPPLPNIRFILNAEAAAAFDELTLNNEDDLLVRQQRYAWPNLFRTARFIPAVEYIKANRIRKMLIEQMNEMFQKVDVYINPSWGSSSLTMTNLTGHPCIVFPNGFQPDGRPTSITITGKLFDEASLVSIAQDFQEATTFEDQHPELE